MDQNLSLETMESKISSFDKMKFIDEDGVEKISGRDLSKALGYTDFRNFKKAVARANEQIEKNGKNNEQIVEVTSLFNKGNGAKQKGSDYHLTRRQAINVANNADTSKEYVDILDDYFDECRKIRQVYFNNLGHWPEEDFPSQDIKELGINLDEILKELNLENRLIACSPNNLCLVRCITFYEFELFFYYW